MKGIKMTLDTTVNKNYVEDWRKVGKVGMYDKASDSLTATSAIDEWIILTGDLCATLGKIGDLVTISFDYYGDCTVGGYNLRKESFVRCERSGNTGVIYDYGRVIFIAHDKYHRVWVTYKLTQGEGPRFFFALNTNKNGGTVHIRNIKVELSDHPTDYEGILKIDNSGGGNS